MASVWTILLSVGIVFLVAYISSRAKIPNGLRAVPGPKGIPVLGSALEIGDYPEKTYMKWAREYGELFQVRLGWNNWIFVNSEEAVKVQSLSRLADDAGNPRQTIRQVFLTTVISCGSRHRFRGSTYPIHELLGTMETNSNDNTPVVHTQNVCNLPAVAIVRIETAHLRLARE